MNTGTNLTAKIPHGITSFESYLPNITIIFLRKFFAEGEFRNAFFLLKTNKSAGYHNMHVNIIRNYYNELKTPLMNTFNLSLNTGIFSGKMKVTKVTPIFKKDEKRSILNDRPISVLPCFSKFMKQIVCNRLYHYLP